MANGQDNEFGDLQTNDLISELRRRVTKSVVHSISRIMTPHDALALVLGLIIGITLDILFFPNGLPTSMVALLAGVGTMVCWKL